ncbi:hypothetical protein ABEB36_004819 [Hypothenemus hampei]|uniref:Uncharacterized protein n=1 Tax=Hypothenemus hampei TaxID=57062 RepID=A0ABD1EYG7_HYPHA
MKTAKVVKSSSILLERLSSNICASVKPDQRKIVELKLDAFIVEHFSLKTVGGLQLVELLQTIDASSDVLYQFRFHRIKCSMLIKKFLGPAVLSDLKEEIGHSPYSLIKICKEKNI